MKLRYASGKLQKTCTDKKTARKAYPEDVVIRLYQRLDILRVYNHLGEIEFQAPPLRFHPLRADYPGCYAVKLTAQLRLIFKPCGPVAYLNENDVDLRTVSEIEVVAIGDYHE